MNKISTIPAQHTQNPEQHRDGVERSKPYTGNLIAFNRQLMADRLLEDKAAQIDRSADGSAINPHQLRRTRSCSSIKRSDLSNKSLQNNGQQPVCTTTISEVSRCTQTTLAMPRVKERPRKKCREESLVELSERSSSFDEKRHVGVIGSSRSMPASNDAINCSPRVSKLFLRIPVPVPVPVAVALSLSLVSTSVFSWWIVGQHQSVEAALTASAEQNQRLFDETQRLNSQNSLLEEKLNSALMVTDGLRMETKGLIDDNERLTDENKKLRAESAALDTETIALNKELLDLELALVAKQDSRTVYNFVNVPMDTSVSEDVGPSNIDTALDSYHGSDPYHGSDSHIGNIVGDNYDEFSNNWGTFPPPPGVDKWGFYNE